MIESMKKVRIMALTINAKPETHVVELSEKTSREWAKGYYDIIPWGEIPGYIRPQIFSDFLEDLKAGNDMCRFRGLEIKWFCDRTRIVLKETQKPKGSKMAGKVEIRVKCQNCGRCENQIHEKYAWICPGLICPRCGHETEMQIDLPKPSGGSERLCPLCRFSDDCGMFDALTDTRQAMICKNFSPKPSTRVPCEKCRHFSTCEVKKFMGKTTLSMTCGGFELAGMTFKTAVEAMKVGKKVRRAKWLKERCIHAKPGASSISDLNDSYWTPNPDDFEATDWEMVN